MWAALETLVPSIGLLFLLYLVLRHMMEGDRRERIAQAQWEEEHKSDTPDAPTQPPTTPSASQDS
ncbi:hypothetical protein [Allobranchiibius sp. CTAmp26]|uniref:hypothetical protein n=1 Tax=Allobranchiibius sp. CTAmp26 TaxID=2815214 RepID=UPI001AA0CF2A|nr:hypothetical protein [Allobranchiibius sp. CTAmp26]MBO1753688.1 hypothetical protein [Allobranchiibius sp. CTAmp26]